VEQVYARLKEEFGGQTVRMRGAAKVIAHIMFGILAKNDAVARTLREAFGVSGYDGIRTLSGGMTTALVFRIVVAGRKADRARLTQLWRASQAWPAVGRNTAPRYRLRDSPCREIAPGSFQDRDT